MMNKNMLEFFGQALLNAAHSQQHLEDMNKLIEQNIGADNPFVKSFLNIFGLQNPEKMKGDDIIEFAKKSFETYKEFLQDYLRMFDIVSKEEHLILKKENDDLKAKIDELEKIISSYKNLSGKDNFAPEKIVDNLTVIMRNQTQQFQELMKQMNQPYKKGTAPKKK
jgi:hypothetical protein